MKKIGPLFSALLLTAAITACGTADVNDINDRRIYDVNQYNNGYDVNRYNNGIYDVYDTDLDVEDDRNMSRYPVGDSIFRNDPEANDYDNDILFDSDRDDTFFDDEELTDRNRTYNNR